MLLIYYFDLIYLLDLMNAEEGENIAYELPQDLLKNQIPAARSIPKAHSNSIEAIAAHPSHKTFASGSHDKTIKLWDIGSFK